MEGLADYRVAEIGGRALETRFVTGSIPIISPFPLTSPMLPAEPSTGR